MEIPPNGGDWDTPSIEGRGGTKRVGIPPAGQALRCACNAAGVGTSDLGDETDRAENLEARGPPEEKAAGKSSTTRGAKEGSACQ